MPRNRRGVHPCRTIGNILIFIFGIQVPCLGAQVPELVLPPPRGIDFFAPRPDPGYLPPLKVEEGDESRLRLIALALSWLGTPYALGGRGSGGMDCSGLLNRIIGEAYPYLELPPRRSEDFANYGVPVESIRPGDILLFADGGKIYHVGLALG
ncbi:MAG TPA: NlpC/P60 family protein, partial [Rectinemataceae bacterium]